MSQLAAIISALVPLLTLAGGGMVWFLARIDRRVAAAEQSVKDCETHRIEDKDTIARLSFEVRRDGMAVRMLFGEVHSIDPGNVTLSNVAAVLRQTYDPALAMGDWAEMLGKIEQGDRR